MQKYFAQNAPNWEEHQLKKGEDKQENFKAATKEMIRKAFGDKTFCLIMIFTIGWSSWRKEDHHHEHEGEGENEHGHGHDHEE